MSTSLHVSAAGMVTAVGHDAASSVAAMRARIDGFMETRFLGPRGEWQVGAPVNMPGKRVGADRLAHFAAGAIADVFRKVPEAEVDCALVLCLGERDRPGSPIRDGADFASRVIEAAGFSARHGIDIVAGGRPSGLVALDRARRLLANGGPAHVLILGVDSYLTTLSVAHYLGKRRLLAPGNANGFIPGEAAAAALCSKAGPIRLTGLGFAREAACIYNGLGQDGLDLPLRGNGMSEAYRAALAEANTTLGRVAYRISDLIGEQYWFRQASLARLRLLRGRSELQDLKSPTESLGNTGAAVVPIMLGLALAAAEKGHGPVSPVLVEASSDDGACGAAVFHEVRR